MPDNNSCLFLFCICFISFTLLKFISSETQPLAQPCPLSEPTFIFQTQDQGNFAGLWVRLLKLLSRVWLFVTPWSIQSMEFSRILGVGSLSLLQRIVPTQGSNPGLPHCRWIFYQLSHRGNPRKLEWVADPFSSGSSQPRNWTRVSCIAGGFFTSWASGEAQVYIQSYIITI